jgi:hypothetical protein
MSTAPDFVPTWSAANITRLEQVARESARWLDGQFGTVQLCAATGNMAEAKARLLSLYRRHRTRILGHPQLYHNFVGCFLAVGQFEFAAQIVNEKLGCSGWCDVTFGVDSPQPPNVLRWTVQNREGSAFQFSRDLYSVPNYQMIIANWLSCLPALEAYHHSEAWRRGEIALNVGDHGVVPGLAFSDFRPNYFLIPDPQFQSTRAYQGVREFCARNDVRWEDRIPLAFWRGATTGRYPAPGVGNWRLLPRVRLCTLAQSRADLFDVGLNRIVQIASPEDIHAIEEAGLMRSSVPDTTFNRYRYQIDIDGNSNSWAGLFIKLLTGSPVLKIASPLGFRQWYYDLLEPWVNFVPIASDMSDLVEKAEWLRSDEDRARRIGERGKELAHFLSYDSEIKRCSDTLAAAFSFFNLPAN